MLLFGVVIKLLVFIFIFYFFTIFKGSRYKSNQVITNISTEGFRDFLPLVYTAFGTIAVMIAIFALGHTSLFPLPADITLSTNAHESNISDNFDSDLVVFFLALLVAFLTIIGISYLIGRNRNLGFVTPLLLGITTGPIGWVIMLLVKGYKTPGSHIQTNSTSESSIRFEHVITILSQPFSIEKLTALLIDPIDREITQYILACNSKKRYLVTIDKETLRWWNKNYSIVLPGELSMLDQLSSNAPIKMSNVKTTFILGILYFAILMILKIFII